jgi:Transposase DDE domain
MRGNGLPPAYEPRATHAKPKAFLSRIKENMGRARLEARGIDPKSPRHHGVQADQRIPLNGGHELRLVTYTEPAGQTYQFLTNDFRLPPGVLAELYRQRWEIEKVFDALKSKLGERHAWGRMEGRRRGTRPVWVRAFGRGALPEARCP